MDIEVFFLVNLSQHFQHGTSTRLLFQNVTGSQSVEKGESSQIRDLSNAIHKRSEAKMWGLVCVVTR